MHNDFSDFHPTEIQYLRDFYFDLWKDELPDDEVNEQKAKGFVKEAFSRDMLTFFKAEYWQIKDTECQLFHSLATQFLTDTAGYKGMTFGQNITSWLPEGVDAKPHVEELFEKLWSMYIRLPDVKKDFEPEVQEENFVSKLMNFFR